MPGLYQMINTHFFHSPYYLYPWEFISLFPKIYDFVDTAKVSDFFIHFRFSTDIL